MSYNDLLAVVQDKFSSSERVIGVLSETVVVLQESSSKDRILALVEYAEEKALFVLHSTCTPPKTFSDLSVEIILPLDKDFECLIDNEQKSTESFVQLCVTSKKLKFIFKRRAGSETSNFVDDIFRAVRALTKLPSPPKLLWLQKYNTDGDKRNDDTVVDIILPCHPIAQGTAGLALRESQINHEMMIKEDYFTYGQIFNIFTATWNVNGQPPAVSLKNWLSVESDPPDIYAVGFQELDLKFEPYVFDQTPREAEWLEAVLLGVDERVQYVKVDTVRLVGMMLVVLIKEKYYPFVRNVAKCSVPTGIMGIIGNKGGVSLRFELHNTSLCFVNSHLAAGVEECERRNQDFHSICTRTQFNIMNPTSKGVKDHDQIYWVGDLNYRIMELDQEAVKKMLDNNNMRAILEFDQLKRQHLAHNIFSGYNEGDINFRPTYKYDLGTDNWDSSEKNRPPAWCDRILWKGNPITQTAYKSHMSFVISDHKPVSASFRTEIKIIDDKKYRQIHEEVIRKLDKFENELIPQVMVDRTELDFDNVRYLERSIRNMTIANTGQVPVQFEFIIKHPGESNFCKEWLTVEPYTKCIYPGEKCDVHLEIYVNKKSAHKLNSGADQLYDILVLHLQGGKDIFITVTGTYKRSCFGSSIEALVHIKVPIKEILAGRLIELEAQRDALISFDDTYPVPKEIWFLVDHLFLHGLTQPNLFEQPGLHSEFQQIRDWLDNGATTSIPGSIHSIAEALLIFLESTPDPLIPYNLHSVCLSASSNYSQCKQIIMQLPEFRKNVFLYLCEFLHQVLRYSDENGQSSATLSALFGAIFLRDTPNMQTELRYRSTKQIIAKKKASFMNHFLVNDQSEFIYWPSTTKT